MSRIECIGRILVDTGRIVVMPLLPAGCSRVPKYSPEPSLPGGSVSPPKCLLWIKLSTTPTVSGCFVFTQASLLGVTRDAL